MAGSGIAMQVDGAGGLEDAAQLNEPRRHHDQVGHHRIAADKLPEGLDHVLDVVRPDGFRMISRSNVRCDSWVHSQVSVKRNWDLEMRLGGRATTTRFSGYRWRDVVRGVRIEWRVQVDEVDRQGMMSSNSCQVPVGSLYMRVFF